MIDLDQLTEICQFLSDRPNQFATIWQLRRAFPQSKIYEPTSKERHELLQKHKVILFLWATNRHPKLTEVRHGWQLAKDWQKSLEHIAKSPRPGDMVLGNYDLQPQSGDLVLSPNLTTLVKNSSPA
jgi:hypothetical protein